jgi:uncharacterized membrane protein
MKTTRLEAFSDGVAAIILTIMVLDLRVPEDTTFMGLYLLLPTALSYLLSYVMLAIYWVNHHHLLHLAPRVTRMLLWWNMNLLFWMSLIPFVTAYLGKYGVTPIAALLYSAVAFLCSVAFYLLRRTIAEQHKHMPALCELHDRMSRKNVIAMALYGAAVVAAYFFPWVSMILVILPAVMYFFPDRRVEELGEEDVDPEKAHGEEET